MKKTALLLAVVFLFCLTACNNSSNTLETSSGTTPTKQHTENTTQEINDTQSIQIVIGGKTFTANLHNTPAAAQFKSMLPLTIKMEELHGNEKFAYLEKNLPTYPIAPSSINAGDLMLFGNNCLVVFYQSFPTTFTYTPIGSIKEIDQLEQTLGKGSVEVTFQ